MVRTFLFFLIICISQLVYAQEHEQQETKLHTQFTAGYIAGAQIYNDNFLYNPGFFANMSVQKPLSPHISIGLGTGFTRLQSERFVPVYIDVFSYRTKKKTSNFLQFHFGYAHGWDVQQAPMADYTYRGGIYLSFGTGRAVSLNDTYALAFSWSYAHQFGSISYSIYGNTPFRETINYDMFRFALSLMLK